MAQILVRDLDRELVSRLKARAEHDGRSLQSEVKMILEQAASVDMRTARRLVGVIQRRLRGRKFTDSAKLIRESRQR